MPHVVVINLDRATVRMRHMQSMLDGMGIDFERISAVDGKNLDKIHTDELAPFLIQKEQFSSAEIGTFLSHRKAWQSTIDSKNEWTLILEDDVLASQNLAKFAHSSEWIPENAACIRLEARGEGGWLSNLNRSADPAYQLQRMRSIQWGLAAYIISKSHARFLIDHSHKLERVIDGYVNSHDMLYRHQQTYYQVTPSPCLQFDYFAQIRPGARSDISPDLMSSVEEERNARNALRLQRPRGARLVVRELTRPIKQLFAPIRNAGRKLILKEHFREPEVDMDLMLTTNKKQ